MRRFLQCLALAPVVLAFASRAAADTEHGLITLDPGHFHAALVQKSMYPNVRPLVHVYAPDGPDLDLHLARIDGFNTRADDPTHWRTVLHTGDDYLERLVAERPGDIVVISGNNRKKADYILAALNAGLNVYADKPMAINREQFLALEEAVDIARRERLMLFDIMTERYEITSILQKALSRMPSVYGTQLAGTADEPGITKESVHHFFKFVAGAPLRRPPWFFDAAQEGDGLVDVSTHLVDLIQWACFPEQAIDYRRDIELVSARGWPTRVTLAQFQEVTGLDVFPDYLRANVRDGVLDVFANGEISYRLRGIHARVRVGWEFVAPDGGGDTHYSVMRGSRANLVIRQGAEQAFVPELYIEPVAGAGLEEAALDEAIAQLAADYPGLRTVREGAGWRVAIPAAYRVGHEAHFAQVTETFLAYLDAGEPPAWEWPNLLAKYYVTTAAHEMAAKTRTGTGDPTF